MRKYELMVIILSSLTEEKRQLVLKKIEELIKKDGRVIKTESLGKRSLAYPIKKQTEGYYYLWQLELNPLIAKNLSKTLQLEDEVIRLLLVKKP